MEIPNGIDIIIPVYNAYEDLRTCIESVLECTDLCHHRLLLVNDASSDERILPYLNELSLNHENILHIENETNLGFSGSINHGIQVSGTRDVLLLNSDTMVTKNWVEKLVACAYSDPSIATVTPLSNNATLCSVPEFLKENRLPEGYSLEQYATLIEEVSLRAYPAIPVSNGFCMYIKREVLEEIGLLDAETFGRGYGEENDFCYRAEQAGYLHVMCDDTYIYHTGTASFVSEEKRRYIAEHEKILNERYPEQNHAVAVHCRDNPNERIQENIKLWTGLRNGKRNILYLVQADFRPDAHDHLGGTQLHVKDLMTVMRNDFNVFVAARNQDYLNLTAYTEAEEFVFRFYIGKPPRYPEFRSTRFATLYGMILDTFRIDLVHIHHTKDLTLELYYQAYAREIPVVATLHDYYTACPSIKMVNFRGNLCIGKESETCCRECQKRMPNGGPVVYEGTDYLGIWRKRHGEALRMAASLVTPSESAKRVLLMYYPEIEGKIQVIPHGVQVMKRAEKANGESTHSLHIAFIGGISKEKGSLASYQLIKNGPNDVQWYLFGVWGYNELSMLEKKNYTKTGLYEREELPGLMAQYQIDLVCILPIWPETYCYTLSEAIMCGVPSIVTDIGALGERMRELNCGWLVSVEHAYEEALEIIERIHDKNEEYQEKLNTARSLQVKTLDEMKKEYLDLYTSLFKQPEASTFTVKEELKKNILGGYLLGQNKKICLEADGDLLQERLEELDAQIKAITNSFTYKCMRAIGEIHIPGRKHIKKFLYMIYRLAKRN